MGVWSRYVDVFTPAEQELHTKYWDLEKFAEKTLHYADNYFICKCDLTPQEVGMFKAVIVPEFKLFVLHSYEGSVC